MPSRRQWVVPLLCLAWACAITPASDDQAVKGGEALAGLFAGRVQPLHLTLPESAMAELAREPRKYVKGSLRLAGLRMSDVGVRFKGHRSMRQWSSKPAFKIDLAKYRKGQNLGGVEQLAINNMVEDASMLREQLAFEVFRLLGVPAPRTGYVELFVNGQRFGLYAVVEAVHGSFLERHFGHDAVAYEGEYGCDVHPGDVPGMALDVGKDPQRAALRKLAEAAQGPVMGLLDGGDALLESDHFFGFLVASAWISDFDGYRHAHNYRLVFSRSAEKWTIVPWGLDRTFDRDLTPFDSYGLLARACFDEAACRLRYVQTFQLALTTLDEAKLVDRMDWLAEQIEPAARRDGRKPHGMRSRVRARTDLRRFLRSRSAALRPRLDCWDGSQELDRDGDGFGCMDCNDRDATVHPGARERCDGVDADCSGLADDAAHCPCVDSPDAVGFLLCASPLSWPQAAAQCESRGGVLASLTSRAQARALARATRAIREDDWWIGLHDRDVEGRHRYHGARKEHDAGSFVWWAAGEPDDYACGQDCAALKDGGKGRFRDLHCESRRPFVCATDPVAKQL